MVSNILQLWIMKILFDVISIIIAVIIILISHKLHQKWLTIFITVPFIAELIIWTRKAFELFQSTQAHIVIIVVECIIYPAILILWIVIHNNHLLTKDDNQEQT